MSEIRTFSPEEAVIFKQENPDAELVALTEALRRVLTEEKN
jgi:hypothetical protein